MAGKFTVSEENLNILLNELCENTGKFAEPSATTSLIFSRFLNSKEFLNFIKLNSINKNNITDISWLTGGKLVPKEDRKKFLNNKNNI